MPTLKLVPTLIVDDMLKTVARCRDVLESQLLEAEPPQEPRWARLPCGGVEIMPQTRECPLEERRSYCNFLSAAPLTCMFGSTPLKAVSVFILLSVSVILR